MIESVRVRVNEILVVIKATDQQITYFGVNRNSGREINTLVRLRVYDRRSNPFQSKSMQLQRERDEKKNTVDKQNCFVEINILMQ